MDKPANTEVIAKINPTIAFLFLSMVLRILINNVSKTNKNVKYLFALYDYPSHDIMIISYS